MRKWNRFLGVAVVVILMIALLVTTACTPKEEAPAVPAVQKYLFGSTSTSSSWYVEAVTLIRIMNKYVPEASITVVESGATMDDSKRMHQGDISGHFASNFDGVLAAFKGTVDPFKGDPATEARVLIILGAIPQPIVVRADSGITKLDDLNGKSFSGGIVGSSAEYNAKAFFDANGVKVDWYLGSWADAITAIKDRRCVGMCKAMAGLTSLDASMLDVQSMTPIRMISPTDEQMKKGLAVLPGLGDITVPAGSIPTLPDEPAFTAMAPATGGFVSSAVPQELQYKWFKALIEHHSEFEAGFPTLAGFDPIELTPKMVALPEPPGLLSAGTVQYLEEIGVTVPPEIIPPEYVRK